LGAFQDSLGHHFDIPRLDNEEMAFRCYCASGGLIGYLCNIFRQAVWSAIDEGRATIDLDNLRVAHIAAIWTFGSTSHSLSPFCRKFQGTFSEELIAQAREIGLPRAAVSMARSRNATARVVRTRNI